MRRRAVRGLLTQSREGSEVTARRAVPPSSLEEHGREDCDVAGPCNRRATGRFSGVAAEIMRLLASAVTAYNQHKARRL